MQCKISGLPVAIVHPGEDDPPLRDRHKASASNVLATRDHSGDITCVLAARSLPGSDGARACQCRIDGDSGYSLTKPHGSFNGPRLSTIRNALGAIAASIAEDGYSRNDASFFTIYGHLREGGCEAIADCADFDSAKRVAPVFAP